MKVTDAAAHDGARLRANITASEVWADTACRSKANEEYLERVDKASRIHHRKPKGWPMSAPMVCGNRIESRIPAKVEYVFA